MKRQLLKYNTLVERSLSRGYAGPIPCIYRGGSFIQRPGTRRCPHGKAQNRPDRFKINSGPASTVTC
jgi:hypothetical protein